ncbi:hypothetical protein JIY74_35675 [Vibrio harveyi]|nr:hypothetical protein [Vibrio harveyi]
MISRKKLSSLLITLSLSLSAVVPTSAVLINNHITRSNFSKNENTPQNLISSLNDQIAKLKTAILNIGEELGKKNLELQTLKQSNTNLQSEVNDLTNKVDAFKNF